MGIARKTTNMLFDAKVLGKHFFKLSPIIGVAICAGEFSPFLNRFKPTKNKMYDLFRISNPNGSIEISPGKILEKWTTILDTKPHLFERKH